MDITQVFGLIAPWMRDSPKNRFKLLNLYIQLFISSKKEGQNNDITYHYLDAIRNIYKSTAFQQREDDLLQILHSNYDGSIIDKIIIIKNEEEQLLFMKYDTNDYYEIWHKAILNGNVEDYKIIGLFHKLKEIRNRQFSFCNLKNVTIPDSVKSIGIAAFRSNKLRSVEISDSIESIGDLAFQGNELESVIIPNSVKVIGKNAFIDNKLTSVKIPIHTDVHTFTFDPGVQIIRKSA